MKNSDKLIKDCDDGMKSEVTEVAQDQRTLCGNGV